MQTYFETIGWQPVIGDPTFMGWFTVVAYLAAAVLCVQVFKANKYLFGRKRFQQKSLWLILAIAMILLCINKQLDLQSFFTASLKHFFIQSGLYENRRAYQETFIILIGIGGLLAAVAVIVELRQVIRKHLLAVFGLFLLLLFIVLRAAVYNRLAPYLGSAGDLVAITLELGGITLIIINSLWLLRRKQLVLKNNR